MVRSIFLSNDIWNNGFMMPLPVLHLTAFTQVMDFHETCYEQHAIGCF
jgi:hypothetical protein